MLCIVGVIVAGPTRAGGCAPACASPTVVGAKARVPGGPHGRSVPWLTLLRVATVTLHSDVRDALAAPRHALPSKHARGGRQQRRAAQRPARARVRARQKLAHTYDSECVTFFSPCCRRAPRCGLAPGAWAGGAPCARRRLRAPRAQAGEGGCLTKWGTRQPLLPYFSMTLASLFFTQPLPP